MVLLTLHNFHLLVIRLEILTMKHFGDRKCGMQIRLIKRIVFM
uniref:Uncharacterized protein n=1 Tax=Ascaris lumbricoides TaxID=6252 RepID=A0A0M3HK63_ASCLU